MFLLGRYLILFLICISLICTYSLSSKQNCRKSHGDSHGVEISLFSKLEKIQRNNQPKNKYKIINQTKFVNLF